MVHRVRASVRFTKASGLGPWAKAQMDVRYAQAIHLNEGLANEEPKRNEVVAGEDHDIFICDLPLMNEAHAVDAFNTLTAASVFHPQHVSAFPGEDGGPSWVERHTCGHDEDPPQPCVVQQRKELPE